MRAKLAENKRYKARGISLPPNIWPLAFARAEKLDITFSKYVQRLIRRDLERSILKP